MCHRLGRSVAAILIASPIKGSGLRGLRWVGVGRREVGEGLARWATGAVDAVANRGTVAAGDQQREEPVHHVVVECPAAAGAVLLTASGGELDLEERTTLDVGLGEVEHQ